MENIPPHVTGGSNPRSRRRAEGGVRTALTTDIIKVLAYREIKISMDGKGAWRDNVFVERLWWTITYEDVYLRAYANASEARAGIARYLSFCNSRHLDSALAGKTPDQASLNHPMPDAVAE
jgi:putative transposase